MKHRGFTLVELLIVIVVIGVLAAMMMLSSTESISSAKASNIASNLRNLKTATIAWYTDNLEKVQPDWRITIITNPKKPASAAENTKPIQEWSDKNLQISKYFTEGSGVIFNSSSRETATNSTKLGYGCYGICDGGSKAGRDKWYAGYVFMENEGKVREKLKGRMKALGLMFGDRDAHSNTTDEAVWLRIF